MGFVDVGREVCLLVCSVGECVNVRALVVLREPDDELAIGTWRSKVDDTEPVLFSAPQIFPSATPTMSRSAHLKTIPPQSNDQEPAPQRLKV